jgi:N-methylhydantoinase A/oxoprolinase/acetone carboxylase beta subunit
VLVGNNCVVPTDTDVANALGAVVGQVRVSVEALVAQPREGLFRISVGDLLRDFTDEGTALAAAESRVRELVSERALAAGTDAAEIVVSHDVRTSIIEGQRMFIEARVVAVASGRPRIAG